MRAGCHSRPTPGTTACSGAVPDRVVGPGAGRRWAGGVRVTPNGYLVTITDAEEGLMCPVEGSARGGFQALCG